jgi:hypothetical protein
LWLEKFTGFQHGFPGLRLYRLELVSHPVVDLPELGGHVGLIPEYFLHPDCLLQVVVNPYRELEAVVLFGVFPVENLPEEVVQVLVLWYVAHRRPDGVVLSVGSSLSPDDPDFLVDLLVGVLALVLQEVVRCEDSEWLFIRGSQLIDVTLYG